MARKPLKQLKVLYVDNEKDEVGVMEEFLKIIGHQPIGAYTGDEARAILEQDKNNDHKIDVVISDFFLQEGEDGVELVASLLKIRPEIFRFVITRESDTFDDIMKQIVKYDIYLHGFCPKKKLDIMLEKWLDYVVRTSGIRANRNIQTNYKGRLVKVLNSTLKSNYL